MTVHANICAQGKRRDLDEGIFRENLVVLEHSSAHSVVRLVLCGESIARSNIGPTTFQWPSGLSVRPWLGLALLEEFSGCPIAQVRRRRGENVDPSWTDLSEELNVVTLLEFLQARLTEDELTALAAIEGSPLWRSSLSFRDVKDDDGRYIIAADRRHPSAEQAAHIARHGPARVLADVEARRMVIADYLRLDAAGDLLERGVIEDVLRHLAFVYADHPDYNPSWS